MIAFLPRKFDTGASPSGCLGDRMKRTQLLLFFLIVLALAPGFAHAQAWSGFVPAGTAVGWSSFGVPGGIPSRPWMPSRPPIRTSPVGQRPNDSTSCIHAARDSCETTHLRL